MPKYDINAVYDRTNGCCHLCGRKLAFRNYGKLNTRGSWEVDHSVARARGGTNRANNQYAACTHCNRSKRHGTTRSARAKNGRTAAPLSRQRREAKQKENAFKLGALAAVTAKILGATNPAILLLAGIGAALGHGEEPDPQKWIR